MDQRINSEFTWSEEFQVTPEVLRAFEENGYVMIRGLLTAAETAHLRAALESPSGVASRAYGRDDGAGRRTRSALWNRPGSDVTGAVARAEKVVGTFEQLLRGELYHYHSKVIMKEAHVGGMHVWHQDYGYWYENGCLFPTMGTVWIAVDKADRENGCVQLLSGSHLLGRVDHTRVGDQAGADPERVELASKVCPLVHAECSPGDAFFFHCNVLHTSSQNRSPRRRWGFLVAYNRADNDPVYEHHHPGYTKLDKLPNSSILTSSTTTDLADSDFFTGVAADVSVQKLTREGQEGAGGK